MIGLPDEEWGERVAAFIIPKPDSAFQEEDLRSYFKTRLSPFKVPKQYELVKDFPRSPAGKILKRKLSRKFREKT